MRFFFPLRFVSGFSFSANRRRFTPGKPRSRPCASRNESTSLREVRSKIRFSAGTVRIIYCSPAKIRSQKSQVPPNSRYRPISERGTASDYISSDCAPWSKTRSTPLEKHVFERHWTHSENRMSDSLGLSARKRRKYVGNKSKKRIKEEKNGIRVNRAICFVTPCIRAR